MYKILIIVVFAIILCGIIIVCNSMPEVAQDTQLIMKSTFPDMESELEGEFLVNPSDVIFHNSQYIVADGMDARVKIFTDMGRFVREIGRSGQGPGEMIAVFDIALNKDNNIIYTTDASSGRINSYTIDGEYISTIRGFSSFNQIEYNSGRIYAGSFSSATKSLFKIYDISGEFVKNFGEQFVEKINESKYARNLYSNKLLSYGDAIYAFYGYIPYYEMYDVDGMLEKRVLLNVDFFSDTYDQNIKNLLAGPIDGRLRIHSFHSGVVFDGKNIYYNVRPKTEKLIIYVVDLNGELVRTIPFQTKFSLPFNRLLVAKNENQFIFTDRLNAQVNVFVEK